MPACGLLRLHLGAARAGLRRSTSVACATAPSGSSGDERKDEVHLEVELC